MVVGCINKWTPPWKSGGIPRIRTRISLCVENEEGNAGLDGRTCFARPNSQTRTGIRDTGNVFLFSSVDHNHNHYNSSIRLDCQPYPVDHTLL